MPANLENSAVAAALEKVNFHSNPKERQFLSLKNPMDRGECSNDYTIALISHANQRRQWHPTPVTLAWKIPWTEEPGRLQSMGSLRVGHDWATSLPLFTFLHWRRKWQRTPVFLPGESQGRGSLVSCHLWGRRVRHDWSDLAAAAAHANKECSKFSKPEFNS